MIRRAWRWWALLWWVTAVLAQDFSYTVEVRSPEPFRQLLEANLEIYKWRDNPRMDEAQLKSLVERTADEIRTLLESEGHYSPKIDSALERRNGAWVTRFRVEPGDPVRVKDVRIAFEGPIVSQPDGPDPSGLREGWKLKPGAVFRHADWEDAKRALLAQLLLNRYPAASIAHSQATVNPETREVELEVRLASGPPFTFGKPVIEGLERYPASLVENLNPIAPGTPYSQEKLLEYQARLQDSGYFASVAVSAEIDPARPEQVPIKVSVVEAKSRKVEFGLGYSTNTGNRVQVAYEDRNIFGRGWRWKSELKLETKTQRLASDLYLPLDARGQRDSAGVKLERTDVSGEVTRKLGAGVRRGRVRGHIETLLALEYLLEEQRIAGAEGETRRALALNYSWTTRRTDSLLYPTRGYVLNLQLGGAAKALLSDQDFVRGYARGAWFYPVSERSQLSLRGELGVVAAQSRRGIPSEFLFRAGGDQSVRGYAYQSLGVREGDAVVGGRYLRVASAEYTYWLTPQWGAAAFVDAGNAGDERRELRLAQGYGLGARWKSPVGPVNLDVAYGRDTEEVRLHFSLGFAF